MQDLVDGLNSALWLSPAVLGVLGLLVGSFLNVVIYRKPVIMMRGWVMSTAEMLVDGEEIPLALGKPQPQEYTALGEQLIAELEALPHLGIATPRSRCSHCGHQIRWYENLPIVSWLALRGRCSSCKTPISIRYPIVEAATGALFALAAWRFGPQLSTLAWCAAFALMISMALIDADTKYLPDDLTYPLLWGGVIVAMLGWTIPLQASIWGVVAGFVPLWLIAEGFRLAMNREGLGGGDLKLLAALGAWTGWQGVLPIILLASIVGLCVHLPRAMMGASARGKQFPFGPFLVGGGLIVMLVGASNCLEWIGVSVPG